MAVTAAASTPWRPALFSQLLALGLPQRCCSPISKSLDPEVKEALLAGRDGMYAPQEGKSEGQEERGAAAACAQQGAREARWNADGAPDCQVGGGWQLLSGERWETCSASRQLSVQ